VADAGAVPMPVQQLRAWAEASPADSAVVTPEGVTTVGELWDTARRLAGWMRTRGVGLDEVVAAAVPLELEPAMLMALLIRGGPSASFRPRLEVGPDEIVTRLVSSAEYPGAPVGSVLLFDADAAARLAFIDPDEVVPAEYKPEDPIRIFWSSGTTGAPKGIEISAKALDARTDQRRIELLSGIRSATMMQFSSSSAQSVFALAIAERRPFLRAQDPRDFVQLAAAYRVTAVEASPHQLAGFLTAARELDERLEALDRIFAQGAAIAPRQAQLLHEWFRADVYDLLGSSETGALSVRRVAGDDRPGPSFFTCRGVVIDIVDDAGQHVDDGREGRLRVSSPGLYTGYSRGAHAGPGRGVIDGWFSSGDIARLDGDGLTILGRDDDLLNIGGRKILAGSAEKAVTAHPGVTDAVAALVRSAQGVEHLAIAFVGAASADPEIWAEEVARDVSGIRPSLFVRLAKLPRSPDGKLLRQEIASLLQERFTRVGPVLPPPGSALAGDQVPPAGRDHPVADETRRRTRAPLSPVLAARDWAADSPRDPFIVGHGLELSIGELWETSLRVAGWLRAIGVDRSEAIGTALPPDLQPAFLLGLLISGNPGAAVRGNAQVGPSAPLRRVITTSLLPWIPAEAQILFTQPALEVLAGIDPGTVEIAEFAPDDIVRIAYSSGTTGRPKAIARTAESFEVRLAVGRQRIAPSMKFATLQPMTASNTQRRVLSALIDRNPHLVIGNQLAESLPLIADWTIERLDGSPFQFDTILLAAQRENLRLPALRELHSTGAPMPPTLARSLADWFGATVYDSYGSNEGGLVALRRADGPDAEVSRGGTVFEGVEVEIVDDELRAVPDGEVGRIRVKTPGMAASYLGTVDTTPRRGFHDGWFYAGDLGSLDGRQLTVIGRDDGVINIGGMKMLPEEIEAAVLRQPGIRDAVAGTVVDRLGVRQLAIAIVGDPVDDPAQLSLKLRGPLGGLAPSIIVRMSSIPRTDSGKALRDHVIEQLQKRMDASGPII